VTTAAEALVRKVQRSRQISRNGFLGRTRRGNRYLADATGFESLRGPPTHSRADDYIAARQCGQYSSVTMRFLPGGMTAAGALIVRVLHLVRPHFPALDLPFLDFEDQKSGAPTEVWGNRLAVVRG
jgi:hypothetical protein